MNNWLVFLIVFLVSAVTYNQSFKLGLNKSNNNGAYIALVSLLTSLFSLLFIPFFKLKFDLNIYKILMLIITCILYSIVDRINVYVRKKIDVSLFSLLRQFSYAFMIFIGFIFFKEKFVLIKFIGAILILLSNMIVLYDGRKYNRIDKKILLLSLLSSLLFSITLFLNVNLSRCFNIPIYVFIILFIPFVCISIFDKINISKLKNEYIKGDRKQILLTSLASSIMLISQLRAYELGSVVIVSSLCSLTIILNIFFSYFILKEKNNFIKKLIAAIIIILSIVLIKI